MTIKEKISFAINQIPINNCDNSPNEKAIKAVRLLQEVYNDLSKEKFSEKLTQFIKNQKNINNDILNIVNENFWDLI